MIKAIIFDMDGVIIDSEKYQFEAFRKLFSKFNINLTKNNFNWAGKKARDNIQSVLIKYNKHENADLLDEQRHKIYIDLIKDNIKPMPGAIKLINTISKKYKLAVASSSVMETVEMVLSGLRIKEKFKVIVSGDQIRRGKPNPPIFLKTAKKLKTIPKYCLVIEDSESGVLAAKRAGMNVIAVPNKYTKNHNFSKADLTIKSLNEIDLKTPEIFNKP